MKKLTKGFDVVPQLRNLKSYSHGLKFYTSLSQSVYLYRLLTEFLLYTVLKLIVLLIMLHHKPSRQSLGLKRYSLVDN